MGQLSSTTAACIMVQINCTMPSHTTQHLFLDRFSTKTTASELGDFGIDNFDKFGLEGCSAHEESIDVWLSGCKGIDSKSREEDDELCIRHTEFAAVLGGNASAINNANILCDILANRFLRPCPNFMVHFLRLKKIKIIPKG